MNPTPTPPAPDAQRYNARLGLYLFFLYLMLYIGFVAINAFSPDLMEWRPWGELNLALLYGFGLILFALVLAAVYGCLAKSAHGEGKGS